MAWTYEPPGRYEAPQEREAREQREFQTRQRLHVQKQKNLLRERIGAITEPIRRTQEQKSRFRQLASNFLRQDVENKRQSVDMEKQKFRLKAQELLNTQMQHRPEEEEPPPIPVPRGAFPEGQVPRGAEVSTAGFEPRGGIARDVLGTAYEYGFARPSEAASLVGGKAFEHLRSSRSYYAPGPRGTGTGAEPPQTRLIPSDLEKGIRTIMGDDKARAEVRTRLKEVGIGDQIIGDLFTNPTNVFPVLGFTRADDFAKAVPTFAKAWNALRRGGKVLDESPEAAKLVTGLARAGAQVAEEAPGLTPARYQRVLADFAQAEEINPATQMPTIRPEELVTPEHAAVRNLMQQTGKTSDDLLTDFATTRQVPAELSQTTTSGMRGFEGRLAGEEGGIPRWLTEGSPLSQPQREARAEIKALQEFLANAPEGGTVPASTINRLVRDEAFAQQINAGQFRSPARSWIAKVRNTESVQDAIANGRRLGYSDADIAAFLRRNYHIPDTSTSGMRGFEGRLAGEAEESATGGMRGFEPTPEEAVPRPTNASTATLSDALDALPDEKAQIGVTRRFFGEVHEEGDRLRVFRADNNKIAQRGGITLSHSRTPEAEQLFEALETGNVAGLTPAQSELSQRLRYALRLEEEAMKAVDPAFESRLIDDYFPHLFKKTTQEARRVPTRTGARPGFVRARTLEGGIGDILERRPDLDLRTWNPIEYVNMRIAEGIKYRAALTLRNRLEAKSLALPKSSAPEGWLVPEHPIFQGDQFRPIRPSKAITAEEMAERLRERAAKLEQRITKVEEFDPSELVGGRAVRESMAVPPDVAKYLNHAFGTSAFGDALPLHLIRSLSAAAKTVKVFGGLFQHVDYTLRQLGMGVGEAATGKVRMMPRSVGVSLRATLRGFVPGLDQKMLRSDVTNPIRKALTRNGLQLDGGLDIMERSFRDLLEEPGFLTRAGVTDNRAVRIAKGALDYISSGAYLKAHREHVFSAGEMHVERFMQAGDSLETAAAKAAKLVNEQFSALPQWQSVFQNRTTRDALRTVFFSPNEAEAWWRNFLKPARGAVRRDIGEMGAGVRFYGGIMGSTIIWANIINLASTGELLPADRYNPMDTSRKSPLGIPFTYNTRFLRPTLPFKGPQGQEEYLDLLGQADTPLRWGLDPLFGTKSRLSVPAAVAVQTAPLLTGQPARTFSGAPVRKDDTAQYIASIAAPMPAQSFIEESSRIGQTGAGFQAAGFNVSAEPLRETIARRFQEITGREFNPEVDYLEARQMTELTPLFDELTRRGVEFESEGAMETAKRQQFLAETEQTLRLPEKAQGVARNAPGAGVAFTDSYKDLQTAAANAVALDMLGETLDEPKTPAGKALKAYRDIDSANYFDPVTYETDWGRFMAAREKAKRALPPEYQRALERKLLSQNPDAQSVEPRYKAAAEANRRYHEIPKYKGLDAEEGDMVDAVRRAVEYTRLRSGDPEGFNSRRAFRAIESRIPDEIADFYRKHFLPKPKRRGGLGGGLRGGLGGETHKMDKAGPANPERDALALDNLDLIYFGFVSPNSLSLEQRALLPDYILAGRLQGAESMVR